VSEENVELALAVQPASGIDFAQLFRDDTLWIAWTEANARFFHPDFECVRPGLPDGKIYIGLNGLRDTWREWLAPWTTYRVDIEDFIDLGHRVLVLAHVFGRLEGSQAEVENTVATVWTVRDGSIARGEFYLDRAEALKAVGLEG
jgi:ketosteroid isomerase-like protein